MAVNVQVDLKQAPYIKVNGKAIVVEQAIVQGTIICHEQQLKPEFKVLVKQGELKPYIGCVVAELPNKNLTGIAFDDSRQIGLVNIPVGDRLLKKIYRQKLLS